MPDAFKAPLPPTPWEIVNYGEYAVVIDKNGDHIPGLSNVPAPIATALVDAVNDRDELQATFDLRWDADRRATKRWQAATGRDTIWPDHADLCVWLLEQHDALRAALGRAEHVLSVIRSGVTVPTHTLDDAINKARAELGKETAKKEPGA